MYEVEIGIIGATGPQGSAIGARLASIGYQIVLGSRSQEKASQVAQDIIEAWPTHDLKIRGDLNEQAARCDLVVLATQWEATVPTAMDLKGELAGKTVVSMANALVRSGREFHALVPARGSIASWLQASLPDSKVVACLQHVPASELGAVDRECNCDVLVCSDFDDAAGQVSSILDLVPGMRTIHCGSLSASFAIESLTAVLLTINLKYKTRSSVKISGVGLKPEAP